MKIRPAESHDVARIAEVYRHNHMTTYKGLLPDTYFSNLTTDYCVEKWENYLANPANKIWVACEGEVFLGFVAGFEEAEISLTWYLDSLHVTEAARGKGVGTALIKKIGAYAKENGYTQMSINIVRGNDDARALYVKLGAEHYSCFDDDFCGAVSHSEKLLWKDLNVLL